MMNVADYVIKTLADLGVKHIFLLTGGSSMFLNDAIASEKRIRYVCNQHEQACAMAAEAYGRLTNSLGVINITSGPAGLNTLNGVFGAWTDSVPMLILSGQVKRETLICSYPHLKGLRQLGDQETEIVDIVKSITKYAEIVLKPESIRYHLEKAIYLARTGRQGPCWLDIPIDVQSSQIDETQLEPFIPPAIENTATDKVKQAAISVYEKICQAKRPVILVGNGIRLAQAEKIFDAVTKQLMIPVATAWTARDLIASDDPCYAGHSGFVGDRVGNFTVQNSDLLLILGSRLGIRQVSYNWKAFAREAYKIQVDIDPLEMQKPFAHIDFPIEADLNEFLVALNNVIASQQLSTIPAHTTWLAWCKERLYKYPIYTKKINESNGKLNPYYFYDMLFNHLTPNDTIACANGFASVMAYQVGKIKKGQRLFTNAGAVSMGYELPAAIGAAFADNTRRVICLAGDGSIHLNIQELQTIAYYKLNIIIFVLNNGGYASMRATQTSFFKGNLIGEGPTSGIDFPDLMKLGEAYRLTTFQLDENTLETHLSHVLTHTGPVLCEVFVDPTQLIEPKLASRRLPDGKMFSPPLEDMFPFLDREEMLSNLLINEYTQT